MRFAPMVAVALLAQDLVGCVSCTKSHRASREQERIAYAGMHEFPFQESVARQRIEIGPGSPSYSLDDGRSCFVAFRIPQSAPTSINLPDWP
jgi:hypothetical protein